MAVKHQKRLKVIKRVQRGETAQSVAIAEGVAVEDVVTWRTTFEQGGQAALKAAFPSASKRANAPPDPSITTVAEALAYAAPKKGARTYGQFLSNALAVVIANGLRRRGFEGVLPDESGGFESQSRSARGFKKLDVNYSTSKMGLGLGVSIKTISKRDPETKRYTKNYSRNDNELRAEAMDYHQRQPYAVLVGMLFLPIDSADDAGGGIGDEEGVSCFGAAVKYFRNRCPRPLPDMPADLFEGFFVVAYGAEGDAYFYDVARPRPPRDRRPTRAEAGTLDSALDRIQRIYDRRNNRRFVWASSSIE